jgi:hypothetical protein
MKRPILLLFVVTQLFSCKKDSSSPSCKQDMAGIAGTYKVTAATYKVNSAAPEQDFYTNNLYLTACQKDDLTTLASNGSVTYTDAGTKCTPAGDRTSTWSLSGSTITIEGKAFTIQSYDCSSLVVTSASFLVAGDLLKVTFSRQ